MRFSFKFSDQTIPIIGNNSSMVTRDHVGDAQCGAVARKRGDYCTRLKPLQEFIFHGNSA